MIYGGNECLTYTFHTVVKHLVDDVLMHGSLISHSMFSVEGAFGTLKKTLHGTIGFSTQFIDSKKSSL